VWACARAFACSSDAASFAPHSVVLLRALSSSLPPRAFPLSVCLSLSLSSLWYFFFFCFRFQCLFFTPQFFFKNFFWFEKESFLSSDVVLFEAKLEIADRLDNIDGRTWAAPALSRFCFTPSLLHLFSTSACTSFSFILVQFACSFFSSLFFLGGFFHRF